MGRRRKRIKRELLPEPKYGSLEAAKFINMMMYSGKKSTCQASFYKSMDILSEKTKENPLAVFKKALENVRPRVEVRSRRIGGATYQVPVEVPSSRSLALAIRWLLAVSRKKKGKPMYEKLANELLDAYKGEGETIKRRDELHRMAEANRAFAHYRW
ncbi:MAG TPA: 30S ribosomal protein S7 [bacterium]|uniref:Small ribosomal subunit protein uS7 n=1 Tax=candidate division TA06 bacterium ADurb.Bin417 TaxID=1852828 RepID=A0A1V5MJ84_UNCT6|nr:MAG: 30S ribosomal protein S7 [candidate division TA06 bacterium ADurb.Bin417]HNQ35155.1 30S ribosomal protein S7 [bacterium]HNS48942.1 30S ribosomal protein S7 [bacterium]